MNEGTPDRTSSVTGNGKILVVDDDESMCELLTVGLARHGFDVDFNVTAEGALESIRDDTYDVVLTDIQMQDMDGIEVCRRMVAMKPELPVIVVTGHGTMERAVQAIRAGAYDFIIKPVDIKLLALAVSRGVQHHRLRNELVRLREEAARAEKFDHIVGKSAAMRRVYDLIERVASTDASVLIAGESGTGKELVASAIHERSDRGDGPFVAINCAAMPAQLIESELFGHMRGAFTDASDDRVGLFVRANGGTIFLDEIGELPIEVQPKLLRALQERQVRAVGGNKETSFDARVIAATNRDLPKEIAAGRFREDLYYRINDVGVELPPLRDRGGDILLLSQLFVDRFAARFHKPVTGLTEPAAKALLAYGWPGNVRELENCMERSVALTRFDRITLDDLPDEVQGRGSKSSVRELGFEAPDELLTLQDLEARYIKRVLHDVDGNKSKAARILGLDRRTLYRKLAGDDGSAAAAT